MARVLIIQAEMKQYRVPFFVGLYKALQRDGINLTVVYSGPTQTHAVRQDSADLPAEFGLKVKGYWFAGCLLFQPLWNEIARADLMVVQHENKYVISPFLFLLSALGLKTVALWGIGPNMEEDRSRISEFFREKSLKAADWYFAYTQSIVPYLRQHGVAADRITAVQNAADTSELRNLVEDIREDEVAKAKVALGIRTGPTGIYCGHLDPTKHVKFLVSAVGLARQRLPDFQLLLLGSGPERKWVETVAQQTPWIHYLGSKFGREKALALRMADIFLLPGRVGLAILDSFAAGLPLLTTDLTIHGPEVSYLQDGMNGRRTTHDLQTYADAVVETLTAPVLMAKLRQGAVATGSKHTINAMVQNFEVGIKQCLARHGCTAGATAALPQ